MAEGDDQIHELLDALGLDLDPVGAAPLLGPVVEALLDGPPWPRLQRAGAEAAKTLWEGDDELAAALEREISSLREEYPDATEVALRELEQPPGENPVALALVYRAATALLRRANENRERVEALEKALSEAPSRDHRRLALPLARSAVLAVAVGPEEADEAAARFVEGLPTSLAEIPKALERRTAAVARLLATDERRRALREALEELGSISAEDFPLASEALRSLSAEPIPKDPARDEVWTSFALGLVEEQIDGLLVADEEL